MLLGSEGLGVSPPVYMYGCICVCKADCIPKKADNLKKCVDSKELSCTCITSLLDMVRTDLIGLSRSWGLTKKV